MQSRNIFLSLMEDSDSFSLCSRRNINESPSSKIKWRAYSNAQLMGPKGQDKTGSQIDVEMRNGTGQDTSSVYGTGRDMIDFPKMSTGLDIINPVTSRYIPFPNEILSRCSKS